MPSWSSFSPRTSHNINKRDIFTTDFRPKVQGCHCDGDLCESRNPDKDGKDVVLHTQEKVARPDEDDGPQDKNSHLSHVCMTIPSSCRRNNCSPPPGDVVYRLTAEARKTLVVPELPSPR